jgi:DNA polymerase I-like protein with 3'-5' exonuclease and polymerase domains
MAKTSRYFRAAAAGQQPLFTPPSLWTPPSILPDLRKHKCVSLDTETRDDGLTAKVGAGWATGAGYITGVSYATEQGEAGYIPIRDPDTECFDPAQVTSWLSDLFKSDTTIIMQNAKYDVGWILNDFGVPSPKRLEDTMIMLFALDEDRLSYGLDDICALLGIPGKDESLLREAAAAYGVDPKSEMWKLPARYKGPYAEQDAVATLQAYLKLCPKLEAEDLSESYRLEIDLIPMIVEMRRRGIRVDLDYVAQLREQLQGRVATMLNQLSDRVKAGRRLDIRDLRSSSFKQKLFDSEGLPYPKTERGQPSFEAKEMVKIQHWLPQAIVEISRFENAERKFLGGYVENYAHRGRIHSEIHLTRDSESENDDAGGGTKTTRLAYSDPPLQQMPSRHPELGPAIRRAFLPEAGEICCCPDYSQQEFRLIVHFAKLCRVAGADAPVEIYRRDPEADFHNVVVELTGLKRRDAKDTNFARAYRAGVKKFAAMIGKTEEEAAAIYKQYDDKMPFVSRLMEFVDSRAQQRGYLRLLDGARAHFNRYEPRWLDKEVRAQGYRDNAKMEPCSHTEALRRADDPKHPWYGVRLKRAFCFKAGNKLIQGSAARQTKLAMRAMWQAGICPMLQMHDEIPTSTGDRRTAERVVEIMRDVVKLEVPVVVDFEAAPNWGDAKKIEETGTDGVKRVVYGATWDEAIAWRDSGTMPRRKAS